MNERASISDVRISRIRVYSVVQKVPAFCWSSTMPEVLNTDTNVRLMAENGMHGIRRAQYLYCLVACFCKFLLRAVPFRSSIAK